MSYNFVMTDDELEYLVKNYQPSDDVKAALAPVRLVAVVGPIAVGKSTLIETAVQKSPLLHSVSGVTSRPPRHGEETGQEFTFLTKEQIVEGIKKAEYAQVALSPAGYLYATRPDDYFLAKIGLMAVLSSAIPTFRKIFPQLKVGFVVPSSYEQWLEWFKQRVSAVDNPTARIEEAKTSLAYGLTDPYVHFILNDNIFTAAERLIQVTEGKSPDKETEAKELAVEQLAKLKQHPPNVSNQS